MSTPSPDAPRTHAELIAEVEGRLKMVDAQVQRVTKASMQAILASNEAIERSINAIVLAQREILKSNQMIAKVLERELQ